MAMGDTIRQTNGVPALGYLDLEKIKKESSQYNHKIPVSAALNMPAPPLASPSIYSGPPPPYSYPSSTASSVVGANNGYISPPESRRAPEEDKESAAPLPPKPQSLPSISEALSDQTISISSLLSKPAVSQPPQQAPQASPTSPVSRTRPGSTPIRPPLSLTQAQQPPLYRPQEILEKSSRPQYSPRLPNDTQPPRFPPSSTQSYVPPQPRTVSSPMTQSYPTASAPQLRHSSPPHDAGLRSAPSLTSQPPYSPFHQGYYSYTLPSSNIPPFQPAPLPPLTWRSSGSDLDRAVEVNKAISKGSPKYQTYGETVKRHLDIFDLETSLNEIAEGSGRTLAFTQTYKYEAHKTQRSGPTSQSLPTLSECDDIIKQQRGVLASMERIREVIVKQQQDLAEARQREQGYKASNDYDEESLYGDKGEGGGGFAGADPKKRRGRAAPPGRCHSCNRAETPEWRRGPDGARTLCNACGLHYAKLTRKMGSNKASTGSNLRPKESSPGLTQ